MMSAKFVALTLVGCSSPKVYLDFLSEVQIPSLEVASAKRSVSAGGAILLRLGLSES